jgi:hypothetical protein
LVVLILVKEKSLRHETELRDKWKISIDDRIEQIDKMVSDWPQHDESEKLVLHRCICSSSVSLSEERKGSRFL